ncbi:MAG: orotidine-5'-phosphate decarboxylase [Rickettsiales bacterium]|jgi:orotidine 5'-phosphate decarboxylase subfamily 2|nr:orotidine-5'-phosphate decarboxylase [Rickettsiales bacterium]
MAKMHALQKLSEQVKEKNSRLILGLDPENQELVSDKMVDHVVGLIDETHENIVGIKPNLGFYEWQNRDSLKTIFHYAKTKYPELLKILDAKRGDIGNTQRKYAAADFLNFDPDIVTVAPYTGQADTIRPYLDAKPECAVFALAATSNEDTPVQNLNAGGLKIYQQMALEVRGVDAGRVGLVVGSTKPEDMRDIRAAELEEGYAPENTAWVLAPGFGRQGGNLEFVKYAGPNAVYPISSGLVNPKYLNGRTPGRAALEWKNILNDAAAGGYEMRSVSEYFVDGMISEEILWLAPDANAENWRTLNNGTKSPIYWDIRAVQSYPALFRKAVYLMRRKIERSGVRFDRVASVPYGALALGNAVAYDMGKPVVTMRKEGAKEHGDKDSIVGRFKDGDTAIIIEDVVTSGKSIWEGCEQLSAKGIKVSDAFVLIDRQQEGAADRLAGVYGVKLHSLLKQTEAAKKMPANHPMRDVVLKYLEENVK